MFDGKLEDVKFGEARLAPIQFCYEPTVCQRASVLGIQQGPLATALPTADGVEADKPGPLVRCNSVGPL